MYPEFIPVPIRKRPSSTIDPPSKRLKLMPNDGIDVDIGNDGTDVDIGNDGIDVDIGNDGMDVDIGNDTNRPPSSHSAAMREESTPARCIEINMPVSVSRCLSTSVCVDSVTEAFCLFTWLGLKPDKQRITNVLDPNKPRNKTTLGCTLKEIEEKSCVTS